MMINQPAILASDPCKAKPIATAHDAIIEPTPAVSTPTYPKNKKNTTPFNTILDTLKITF